MPSCRSGPAKQPVRHAIPTLGLLTVAVVASAAALWLSAALSESERHRREADENLWEAYLAQARAGRLSRRVGQRFDSLEAILKQGKFPGIEKELRLYRSIATMDRKAPLPRLGAQMPTWEKAAAMAEAWGLGALAGRIEQMAKEA